MKGKKLIAATLAGALMSASLASCGLSANSVQTQTADAAKEQQAGSSTVATELKADATKLRLSTTIKESELTGSPNGIGVKAMQDYLIEQSGGTFGLDMYLDGTLGSSTDEIIGGAQTGAFEMCALSFGNWGDYTNAFIPLNIPYLFSSEQQVWNFMDGEMGDEIREKVEQDTGMVVLAMLDVGFRNITANKKIASPADMKGLKIRTQNDRYQMAAMEALGATCTSISFSELYSSLQQGVVDAQENPIINTYTNKFYEVQSNMTLDRHSYTMTVLAVSRDAMDKLTADQQAMLVEAGKQAEKASRDSLLEKQEEYLAELSKVMDVYDPTEEELQQFQDVAKSSWSMIENDMGSGCKNRGRSAFFYQPAPIFTAMKNR